MQHLSGFTRHGGQTPSNFEAKRCSLSAHCCVSFRSFFLSLSQSVLRFSRCEICTRLTKQLSDRSLSIESKLGTVKTYREHLHAQFVDRSIQWSLNSLSADHDSNTLMILIDGCDQGKFRIPRHPNHRIIASMNPVLVAHCFHVMCFL